MAILLDGIHIFLIRVLLLEPVRWLWGGFKQTLFRPFSLYFQGAFVLSQFLRKNYRSATIAIL